MKTIVVISVDVPTPEDLVHVVEHLNPPNIPHFTGQVRIAVADEAQRVLDWLDEPEHGWS